VGAVNSAPRIPSVSELLWPTLRAVREIGDSGTIEEIVEKAIELEGFTEAQQAVLHGDGPRTKLEYRLAWARSYLKGMGALDNSERGVWSTTEAGRSTIPEDVVSRHAAYVTTLRETRKAKRLAKAEQEDEFDEESARRDWTARSSHRCCVALWRAARRMNSRGARVSLPVGDYPPSHRRFDRCTPRRTSPARDFAVFPPSGRAEYAQPL
jgi:hypothetical protein